MSKPGSAIQGAEAAQQAEQAWRAVRGDTAIQYAPLNIPQEPPQPTPEWLRSLAEGLGQFFGTAWPFLAALAAALVLYGLWRLFGTNLARAPRVEIDTAEEWRPDRAEAEALLEAADALAAAGHFDEAAHLLLRRSIGHIAAARAEWVRPASTARELSHLAALPEAARSAFAVIAQRVERSRYALRPLGAEDWQAARAAYADFALQRLPAVAG